MKKILLITLLFSSITINAQCYETLKFGGSHTLGIKQDGILWGWGRGAEGELGTANWTEPNPIQVSTITSIQNFYPGELNTFVIKNDGTLWGVGSNIYGSLGVDSTAESFTTFQQITTANNWIKVSPSAFFTLALKIDGTIWAWGQDDTNQTGNPPSNGTQNTPIQVGSASDWIDIASGTSSTAFALKADGTLWGWGFNGASILVPSSSVVSVGTPIQVNGVTGFVKMSVGGNHILAQKADGTLWAWGGGLGRGVGDSAPPQGNIPYPVGTDTWSYFSTGTGTSFGVKTDGTLWAWGVNTNGQLGLGTTANHSVPVQIGTDTNWETVQARKYTTTMATKTDGTVWYWGTNYFGEFGNGQDYLEVYFTTPQLSPNVCVTSLSTPVFEQKALRMYPNPVQNQLFINTEETHQYQIYSVLGTKISEGTLAVGSGIDCSGLTSGVYLINLTNGLGQSSTLKFVKQ